MRNVLVALITLLAFAFNRTEAIPVADTLSPLSSFSAEWNKPGYRACNTAANVTYLNEKEKQVVYILNLARLDPALFLQTVVRQYPTFIGRKQLSQSEYYRSLITFLTHKKSLPLLTPEEDLFTSAKCHAESSGERGYVGHDRRSRACRAVKKYSGECCHYGDDDPLTIVMDLLIDEGVASLGHRLILFTPYTYVGVSLQPHRKYRWNTVLDFQ